MVPFKIESVLKVSFAILSFAVEIYGRCIFNAQFLLAADSLVVMKLLFGLCILCFTLSICACADVGSREYPKRRARRLDVMVSTNVEDVDGNS